MYVTDTDKEILVFSVKKIYSAYHNFYSQWTTVAPLLKATLDKGHLSIKGRMIWQQVLWMPLIFPLTKGHL